MLRRTRRGSVPVEYVVLASFVAAVASIGAVWPSMIGDVMVGSGARMDDPAHGRDVDLDDDGVAPPEAGYEEPPFEDDFWGEDPFGGEEGNGKEKCNQGKGNGAEGCDPGNSNQGDDDRSNDEPGATGRGHGNVK